MPPLHRAEAIGKERLMPREEIPMRDRIIDLLSEPGQDGWHSGEKLAADRKAMTYTFLYRDAKKTLTAPEVDAAHKTVLDALAAKVKELKFR